jgi:formylglycine-generating enzyme required for sulfatase activity
LIAALVLAFAAAGPLVWSSGGRSHAQQQGNRQLTQASARTSQRPLALVIGNGAYQNANPLQHHPNDAKTIADALREVSFEVTLGVNKAQREMKQMMREFAQRLRTQSGVGLFYYAGHSAQSKGHNYLIPVAAEIQSEADLEDAAVDIDYVLNLMDEAQNSLNIVILDAGRNNPFGRSFRSAQDGLAQFKAPTGTLIAYATAPDSIAADGSGANSPYTEELMKQMRVPGVLIKTMFRRVAEQVSSRTGGRQEPWFSANVKGEFYFSVTANASAANSAANSASITEAAIEEALRKAVEDSNDPRDFKDYLAKYPNGAYAAAAQIMLRRLEAAKGTEANPPPANVSSNSTTGRTKPQSSTYKNKYSMEFALIPAGRFMMGSTNGLPDEKPVHQVTISQPFYMGKYEVTQGQWQAMMGNNPSSFKDCGGNCPVEHVSWNDAQDFINKLNESNDGFRYRLPTEAEWEYACRGGTTGDYYGNVNDIGWHDGNSGDKTHAAGGKQANAFGLYDMSGNVWEWCQDWYHNSYNGAPTDGSEWLSVGEQKYRVLRGGSWDGNAGSLRSAFRLRGPSPYRNVDLGFRVVAVR